MSAAGYVKPVSALVGLIGRVILERRRDAAVSLAVSEGDAPVTAILDLVEKDLESVVAPLRVTGEKHTVAVLVEEYNRRRREMTYDERRQRVDEISAALDAYTVAAGTDPTQILAGMRDAHRALVQYATSLDAVRTTWPTSLRPQRCSPRASTPYRRLSPH